MPNIKVYGADWCGLTRSCLRQLDDLGAQYEYIDVDHDPEASEWVKQQDNGKEKKPTLDIDGKGRHGRAIRTVTGWPGFSIAGAPSRGRPTGRG